MPHGTKPATTQQRNNATTQQRNNATTQQRNNATTQQRNNATTDDLLQRCREVREETRRVRRKHAELKNDFLKLRIRLLEAQI
jgi:hypothetical protein